MNCKRECEARPGHAEPGSCEAFISQLAELAVLKLPSWMSLPLLETVHIPYLSITTSFAGTCSLTTLSHLRVYT
eukprot:scaffold152377_cov15-Tisochrysis_lutea.AAC.2